jgi:aspartate carbamoyltransferase catalytic subunit
MTRLQKERWQEYQELIPWKLQRSSVNWDNFCLTPELMKHLDEKVLVMHPLPRNEELAGAVDNDPRCVYFTKQVKNGMKVRMGLLYTIFDDKVCYDPMII